MDNRDREEIDPNKDYTDGKDGNVFDYEEEVKFQKTMGDEDAKT